MRKLPEEMAYDGLNCYPISPFSAEMVKGKGWQYVEIHPQGSRALQAELVAMVERLTDSHANFTRPDLYRDAAALLAKARGEIHPAEKT